MARIDEWHAVLRATAAGPSTEQSQFADAITGDVTAQEQPAQRGPVSGAQWHLNLETPVVLAPVLDVQDHRDTAGDHDGRGTAIHSANHAAHAEQPSVEHAEVQSALATKVTTAASQVAVSVERMSDYLASGYWRETSQAPHSFDTGKDNIVTVNLTGLKAADKAMVHAALDAWAMVADLHFKDVSGRADINFDDKNSGAFTNVYFRPNGDTSYADVNVGAQWTATYGTKIGSYSYQTYLHEIGHALGLGHAGNYGSSRGTNYANDSWQLSVMSYNSQIENKFVDASFAYVTTAMMADVTAIQKLYGAASGDATAGNTTYGSGSDLGNYLDAFFRDGRAGMAKHALTIFDEGGRDTIDFSSDTHGQRVDLNGGKYSDTFGLIGNLGIAQGTVIENYNAGSGADTVTGNFASNTIKTNAGNDSVAAAGGNDILWLGDGNDVGYGGDGNDILNGGDLNDRLFGGDDRDTLSGGAGRDALYGGAGNDTLTGGSQSDTLEGGAGNDSLFGGDDVDILRGSSGNDRLYGGSANDLMDGGVGNDVLSGGSGADAFYFSAGRDVISLFENDVDHLRLNDSLWSERSLTVDQVLSYARVASGNVVFDFGNGNQLTIEHFTDIAALANDLLIY